MRDARAYLPADDHVLVFWPEEDCVSVVALSSIAGSCPPTVGQLCKVRIGKKEHKGVTMEIGMCPYNRTKGVYTYIYYV